MRERNKLVDEPLFWQLLRQGLPMALGMAGHAMFNLIDLAMVGRLGEDAVAGVHVATTINFIPMILGNAVSVTTLALMSQALGAGRRAHAARLSSWSQLVMLLLGVVIGGIGAVLAVPSIDLQGVTGDARAIGIHYLVVSQLGSVTMFALMQCTTTMRALGEGVVPALILIAANLLNIGLNAILIFGWSAVGIPPVGAVGAAYATVIARGVFAVVGYAWIARASCPLRLRFVPLRARIGVLPALLRLGVPSAAQMFLRASAVVAITRLAADYGGEAAVVALGVTTRLDTVVLFASMGFANAATAAAGHAIGAAKPERARTACRIASVQALAFGALIIALFVAFAPELLSLFVAGAGPEVIAAGVLYLGVVGLGQPLACYCVAAAGGVHGAGRMTAPLVLDAIGFGVGFAAAAALLATTPGAGLAHVFWIVVGVNVGLALLYASYVELSGWPRRLAVAAPRGLA
jgi:putative MATE family efflux protein